MLKYDVHYEKYASSLNMKVNLKSCQHLLLQNRDILRIKFGNVEKYMQSNIIF